MSNETIYDSMVFGVAEILEDEDIPTINELITNENTLLRDVKSQRFLGKVDSEGRVIEESLREIEPIFVGSPLSPIKLMVEITQGGGIFAPLECDKSDSDRIFLGHVSPFIAAANVKQNKQSISDGYHTFDELYNHRMYLTTMLLHCLSDLMYYDIAGLNSKFKIEKIFKSKLHYDGTMYENYFIVGIDFGDKFFSYHYDMKQWDLFKVNEIPNAPEWTEERDMSMEELYSRIMG